MNKDAMREKLRDIDLTNQRSAELIEEYYTDYLVDGQDEAILSRFLLSPLLEARREAIIALIFTKDVPWIASPRYAQDALLLHLLGIIEDEEAQFTGVAALYEMASRGNAAAAAILKSLNANKEWKTKFGDDSLRLNTGS